MTHLPTAIKRPNSHSNSAEADIIINHIVVETAHWHIEFFQLTRNLAGFEIQQPKTVCSCKIWTSKPFLKHLQTGQTSTRYDLWVSSPWIFLNLLGEGSLVNKCNLRSMVN